MKKLLILSIALALFCACEGGSSENENSSEQTGDGSASFTCTISDDFSRASGDKWSANDKVGIYMVDYYKGVLKSVDYQNICFTANSSLEFESTTKMYYPEDYEFEMSFWAYYPYSSTNCTDSTCYVDASSGAVDFMVSSESTLYSSANTEAELVFNHKMCKLYFDINFTNFDYVPGDITSVKLSGLPTKFNYNFMSEEFEALNSEEVEFSVSTTQTGYDASYEAIIFPVGEALSGITLSVVTLSNGEKTADLSKYSLNLVSGAVVSAVVEVKKTEAELGSGSITDWNDNEDNEDYLPATPV
ncbi:MAG: fimbrillin family protein [Rikenellaceae bacterium]